MSPAKAKPDEGTADQQQAPHGEPGPVPQVVGSYADYLRAKAHIRPETTVGGGQSVVNVSNGASTLTLLFRCHAEQQWLLRSAEVRRGGQATAFHRGEIAQAVPALLGREPARSSRSPGA
ncbi:MAG TPA: hypothetical protein VMV92_26175 [Streptosporangiaceae bacterium]|nr:hypothetical protein [Streptosporangiaceae bacterium]